ncbi:MAG: protein kinase [Polyangiaceae bacterium]
MTTHPHAATADPTLPPIGSLVAGRYQVARVRGRGMMGVVVEAIDRASGQHVALKILRPEIYASDELRARLEREAAVVAQLRSEHVVRVYGFAHTPEGLPFFVMELLEGSDLDERLRLGTRFSIPEAVGLVRQACEAVAEAHALGVVHRDIKPHNLFLARLPDGRTVLKVLDFGVSKIVNDDAHLTATQVSLGTPLYMPPEQVRSARTIDGRADVWALGTVLFELITGRCPFDGATSHAVIASIIADEPLRLRALVPDAPELLERVILSTLAKDPARRLPSAAALRDALLPFEDARAPDAFAATELANAAAIDDEPTALDTNAATQLGVPVGFDGAPIAAATLHGPTPAGPAATKVDPIPPLAAWAPPAATYVPPAQPSYPQAYPSAPGAPPASPSAPGSRPQNLAPTPVAGSRPARPAPTPTSPAKIALAAIGLPLAAVAVVALIWFGLRRRHATSNTSSSGAPAASISSGPASDETTVAQALARMPNSRAGWSPCIFREGGALPAVLPLPTMPSAIDIDALSPIRRDRS